jgi:drug/metabolite transporter (DMT)-like permease
MRATWIGAGAILLWAFLAVLGRVAAAVPPLELVALGFCLSGCVGVGWLTARGELAVLRQSGWAWAHGVGGLFLYHALFFYALAHAPAAVANLLNYLWPLLIVVFAAPILGMRLGARHIAGMGLAVMGCVLLLGGPVTFQSGAVVGYAAAVSAAVVWALYSVLARRYFAAVPSSCLAGFCLVTGVLAGLGHFMFEANVVPGFAASGALILLGLGPLGAAFMLWDWGMKRGDPRLLGTLAYITPVASTGLLVAFGFVAASGWLFIAAGLVALGGLLAASTPSRLSTTPAR